jgi:hypothetical protein
MSEFKITGDKYVSQWNGSSVNPGTATSPYAHPADAPNSTTNIIVIGTGVYKGKWTGHRKMIGDGHVIMDTIDKTQNNNGDVNNLHLKNFNTLGTFTTFLQDCIIENSNVFLSAALTGCVRNIFLTPISKGEVATRYPLNCIILADMNYTSAFTTMMLNYVDKSARIYFSGTPLNTMVNNLFNGLLNVGGVDYELKKLADGSARLDANPAIADIATIYPDVYTNGNFAGDPKFIDVLKRVVDPDSDLLRKAGTYGYIGGVVPGKKIPVNVAGSDILVTSTDIDITTDTSNWRIASGKSEGVIDIIWKGTEIITEVQRIFLDALLSFDGSETGGSVGNNNVPDIWPTSYSPTTGPGMTPNRLNYALRTSQSVAMPTLDSQWDNDASTLGTTPGDFYIQEWNTKPTILDVLGVKYGNGNPAGLGGTANGIHARWLHARVRLTNNRSF